LATPRQLGRIAEIELQRLAIRSRDINFFFFRINFPRSHLISAGFDRLVIRGRTRLIDG